MYSGDEDGLCWADLDVRGGSGRMFGVEIPRVESDASFWRVVVWSMGGSWVVSWGDHGGL
jgi:hypothetical protein